ncbi:MAG: N-acyl homoserine lactonase family protein [Desulfobacterales bacterium]
MKEKSRVKRMFVLDGGSFLYDTGMMMMGRGMGEKQRIITPFFAFETGEGWMLYDTGWSPGALPVLKALEMAPEISEENTAVNQLDQIGVRPGDVSAVIVSHLHVDHAGGIPFFPDARILVQKDEFAYAMAPNAFQAHAYDRNVTRLSGAGWELLEGDRVIIPGITAMMAAGHTPGLQALVVELPSGRFVILGSDSVYLMNSIETGHPPGNVWNTVSAQYAISRFKALQSMLDARFFPGHDAGFYRNHVTFGTAYE